MVKYLSICIAGRREGGLLVYRGILKYSRKTTTPTRSECLYLNPLSPNSDQHLISSHNITDSSNIQVMRMNEVITKDEMS